MTGLKVYYARYKNISGTLYVNYDYPNKPFCEFISNYFDGPVVADLEEFVIINLIKEVE